MCETIGLGTDLAAIEGSRSGTTSELLLSLLPTSASICSIVSDLIVRSRKYYFVQISTGESTWEVPTAAAPQVPTPGGTPAQMSDPFSKPGQGGDRGNGYGDNYGNNQNYGQNQGSNYGNSGPDDAQEGDRGFKVSRRASWKIDGFRS